MKLEFTAQEVTYSEAIDGEIVQASFQEEPDPNIDYGKKNHPMPPPIKGVFFSASYEFPPYDITAEWCDGKDYDGRVLVREFSLTTSRLQMVLKNDLQLDVSFKTDDITFKNIQEFLTGANR